MKPLTYLFFSMVLAMSCPAFAVEYQNGYQICTFVAPTVMKNCGQKILVLQVLNPRTKRWEVVWDDHSKWIKNYLQFPVPRSSVHFSDNLHHDDELRILRPITIAFSGFKDGPVCVEFSRPPAVHKTLKDSPKRK